MGSLHSGKLFFSVVCRSGDVREPLARARVRAFFSSYIHFVHSRMCTCFVRFRDVYRSSVFVCRSRTHTRTHAPPVKLNLLTRLLGSCAQCARAHTTRRRFAGRTNASSVCMCACAVYDYDRSSRDTTGLYTPQWLSLSLDQVECMHTVCAHTIRCVFI